MEGTVSVSVPGGTGSGVWGGEMALVLWRGCVWEKVGTVRRRVLGLLVKGAV